MNAAELIDLMKDRLTLTSDYQVAKLLGVRRNAITNYRHGQGMDVATTLKAAELLNEDPLKLIAEMELPRAKSAAQRETLLRYSQRTKALLLAGLLGFGGSHGAANTNTAEFNENIYYANNRRRFAQARRLWDALRSFYRGTDNEQSTILGLSC